MAEEKKMMTSIDDEELENVAGGEYDKDHPAPYDYDPGDRVIYWDESNKKSYGHIISRRWGEVWSRSGNYYTWIYVVEDDYTKKQQEIRECRITDY